MSRSTARPAMARPCASIGRPASVVKLIEKASPRVRSASTACSMALALPAGSQLPKASTRCGAETPTTAGSPSMLGSSDAGGQSTITCGSEASRALARSSSARSVAISSCDDASSRADRARVRTSRIAVTTANSKSPTSSTNTAISWRSMLREAPTTSSCSASAGLSAARAGPAANGANSYRKSAEPRTRRAPAPPDRVRHAPSPLLAATAIASGSIASEPANRSTLLSSGIAPKESRS